MINIQNIINEEIMKFLNESVNIMGLKQLAELISNRLGGGEMEADAFLSMLQNAFKKGGDYEVKDMYNKITGTEIDDLSRGKYIFKESKIKLYTPNKTQNNVELIHKQ